MQAFQCSNCDFISIKKEYYCPKCRAQDFQPVTISDEGAVYSHTTIRVAPPEFADLAPYQVILIDMDDNVRVTGFMTEQVEIGDRVKFQEVRNQAYIFEGTN